MKTLLLCLLSSFAGISNAQSSYTVINGYTLEPLDSVTITKDSITATISRTGFVSKTVSIDQLHYGQGLMIILQPTSERLEEEHKGVEYYGEIVRTPPLDYNEDNAQFPGGLTALRQYISRNIRYPQDAMDYEISGKVYVQFIVSDDGSIEHIRILRGLTRSIDAECVRMIQGMPKWEPALIEGKPVSSIFTLPILFALQ